VKIDSIPKIHIFFNGQLTLKLLPVASEKVLIGWKKFISLKNGGKGRIRFEVYCLGFKRVGH
jgi:hypothetical protein